MNLVARVKNILLTPQTEWPMIASESGDTAYLFKNYVAILAVIPAVCVVIGLMMLPFGPMYWLEQNPSGLNRFRIPMGGEF